MTIHPLPPGLAGNSRLDRWVEVRTDGVVEVRTGKVEIGQGITSALAQIAAEELDVDYARIRMIPADTGRSPNEGVTAGSRSTMDGGGALRQACAEVRDAFLQAAARRLDAGVDELFVRDGTIHRNASNESATYWELSVGCYNRFVRWRPAGPNSPTDGKPRRTPRRRCSCRSGPGHRS